MKFDVISGKKVVLYGNNDSIYRFALELAQSEKNNIEVTIIDVRDKNTSPYNKYLKEHNITIWQGYAVVEAKGSKSKVEQLHIAKTNYEDNMWLVDNNIEVVKCNLVGSSGGFNPAVHLDCHTGSKAVFNEKLQTFIPNKKRLYRQGLWCIIRF